MSPETISLKVDVEQPRTWARRLTITVPAERVRRQRDVIARRIAQRVRLPGFRKGHVPAHVLEKQYGQAIERETLEHLVDEAYREALREQNLHPITQAAVDHVHYHPGSDLTFHVEFEVRPEIELQRLGGFRVERPKVEVAGDEVERVIERLRTEQAVWRTYEGTPPVSGDTAAVEITPLKEGEETEPRRYEIVLGEGQAVPDVEAAIQTLEPGAEGEFTVRIAEGPGAEPGREQRVRIRLLEAKRPELPAVDDDFARGLGDFEDLAALRARVQEDLAREAESEAEREVRRRLMDQILEANPFEVPEAMVNQYLDSLIPSGENVDPERLAEFRAATRPAAERAIRRMLVIDRIATLESLEATAADVTRRTEELAARWGRPASEVRSQLQKAGRLSSLADEITEQKVFDYLESMSTIE